MTEKQKKLVSDNHGLIYMFLQEQNLPVEEYYDLAAIGLCKAAIEFNIGSSDFPSFAWNYMNNAVTEEVEREKFPEQSIVYIQEEEQKPNSELLAIPSNEDIVEHIVSRVTVCNFIGTLKKREVQILCLLGKGMNQCKVGQIVGMSQAGISRVRTRAIQRLASMGQ